MFIKKVYWSFHIATLTCITEPYLPEEHENKRSCKFINGQYTKTNIKNFVYL